VARLRANPQNARGHADRDAVTNGSQSKAARAAATPAGRRGCGAAVAMVQAGQSARYCPGNTRPVAAIGGTGLDLAGEYALAAGLTTPQQQLRALEATGNLPPQSQLYTNETVTGFTNRFLPERGAGPQTFREPARRGGGRFQIARNGVDAGVARAAKAARTVGLLKRAPGRAESRSRPTGAHSSEPPSPHRPLHIDDNS